MGTCANPVTFIDATRARTNLLKEDVLAEIERRLSAGSSTLPDAIRQRDLYFRVSVVGHCNLSCEFCHNEGAPTKGRMSLETMESAVIAAKQVGFTRVQFTGGEPLLHPEIAAFVRRAKRYVDDVGITTNGTFLNKTIDALVTAGVSRLHVSLQTESLLLAGTDETWGVPDWLEPTVRLAAAGAFALRLNLPVPAADIVKAESFLDLLDCGIKVFSILPEGDVRLNPYPVNLLEEMVDRVNVRRDAAGIRDRVLLRGYRPPEGIRCATCQDRARCKEQSHSLRLGADLILRPCLATRDWDLSFAVPFEASVREAALLTLDYQW